MEPCDGFHRAFTTGEIDAMVAQRFGIASLTRWQLGSSELVDDADLHVGGSEPGHIGRSRSAQISPDDPSVSAS